MNIRERDEGDIGRLRAMAKSERDPLRRDRLRAVLSALAGDDAPTIARVLGRSRRQVQDWAYAYRDGGIRAIHPPRRAGRPPRIDSAIAQKLKARLDAGATEADGVCTLRGKDVQRILKEELGVACSLQAVYHNLHRLGCSCLSPRPRHERQDLRAQREFREESAPLLSAR